MRLEPGRKPNKTSRRASSLPGVGAPRQVLSRDCRTTRPPYEPHTAQSTETTLPPCRRSTILCPAEPSSRMRCAAPRALAPAARHRVSNALGADRACKRALRRGRRTCVLVSGWSQVLAAARARVARVRVVQNSLAHAQESKRRQCPVATSQNQCARSSEPCVRRPGWPPLPRTRCSRTTSLQAASPSHCQPDPQQR